MSDLDACRSALLVLLEGALAMRVDLDEQQADLFVRYAAFLLERNRVMNLTAIRTPEGVMRTLFLDSLTVLLALPEGARGEELSLCDVGAGGGFPGLPLRIACPRWRLTLIESIAKKARFLREAADHLGLDGVQVIPDRVEVAAALPGMRESADLCVARAVAPLPALIEYCAPLVRVGGRLLFPKSGTVDEEVASAAAAQRVLGTRIDTIAPVPEALDLGAGRVIVSLEKARATPSRFPRRVGLARSEPIA